MEICGHHLVQFSLILVIIAIATYSELTKERRWIMADSKNLNSALHTLLVENEISEIKNVRLRINKNGKSNIGKIIFKDEIGRQVKLTAEISNSPVVE